MDRDAISPKKRQKSMIFAILSRIETRSVARAGGISWAGVVIRGSIRAASEIPRDSRGCVLFWGTFVRSDEDRQLMKSTEH
jgi:hypothetical protein